MIDPESLRAVATVRIDGQARHGADDVVAREEPLELQLGATTLAVIMRTPGHDEELCLGFLLTERIVETTADVVSVRHCTTAQSSEAADNVIRVILEPHVRVDLDSLRRNLFASSSCGVCGKATIDNVMSVGGPVDDPAEFDSAWLASLPELLRGKQPVFEQTGGLHAAGLFAPDGSLLAVREDIGRHNAVDKLVGWAARNHTFPLTGHVLMVSGRISYEIVQKALAARIPAVAAVSAPSSLAVELAQRSNMLLVGFLRDASMNLYAHTDRVG